ncbi:hypothetical protein NEOKW01_1305 [Nematocida sp. AWRm80]|nr:hypothetical protein NEOKW01_1305 [Nematocida sp. AWRm80]
MQAHNTSDELYRHMQRQDILDEDTLPVKKGMSRGDFLMNPLGTILVCGLFAIMNSLVIWFWIDLYFKNGAMIQAALSKLHLASIYETFIAGSGLIEMMAFVSVLALATVIITIIVEWLYTKRIRLAKVVAGVLLGSIIVACILFASTAILHSLGIINSPLGIGIDIAVGIVTLILAYFISRSVVRYQYPYSNQTMLVDAAYVQTQEQNGEIVFSPINNLFQPEPSEGQPPQYTPLIDNSPQNKPYRNRPGELTPLDLQPLVTQKKNDQDDQEDEIHLGKRPSVYDEVENEADPKHKTYQHLQNSYKTILEQDLISKRMNIATPIVLAIWVVVITLPSTMLLFFTNMDVFSLIMNSFDALWYFMTHATLLQNVLLFFTSVSCVWTYFSLVKIVSFFLGSILGELRSGYGIFSIIGRSCRKTFFKGFDIVASGLISSISFVLSYGFLAACRVVQSISSQISNGYGMRSALPSLIIDMFYLIGNIIFTVYNLINDSFKYFSLGMYPESSIRRGNDAVFFARQPSILNISLIILLIIVVIGLILGVAALIFYIITSRIPPPVLAIKHFFEQPIQRLALLAIYAILIVVLFILPLSIVSLTARSQLANHIELNKKLFKYANYYKNDNKKSILS